MPGPTPDPLSNRANLAEIARLFLKLGFTAFGGPAAHVALMEEEIVTRRQWMTRQHFLDTISAVNFIPGPNSTELAIHVGYSRAGWKGLIVAGICFITPAMCTVLPLAWLYVTYGATPALGSALIGVKACMVAIVAVALVRFAHTGIKDSFTATLASLALIASILCNRFAIPQQELIILSLSAIAGMIWYAPVPSLNPPKSPKTIPLLLFPLSLGSVAFPNQLLQLALFFLKVGATLFGSGYVLASFLHSGLVEQHRWLSEQELLDAIAVGQVTPGPLLTAATFIGYVVGVRKFGATTAGGLLSGVVATVAIFLPSFLFVSLLGPVLPRLRKSPRARGALDGMNAAVVSLIATVTAWFAGSILRSPAGINPLAACIFIATLLILLFTRLNPTWLILASAVVATLAHVT